MDTAGAGDTIDVVAIDIGSLAAVRAAVSAAGARAGLSGDTTTDLVIAANELAINVVRHGGGSGQLRIWTTGDSVFCEVRDAGPGMATPEFTLPPQTAVSGRGLWMIQQMTDKFEIETGPTGTTVTISVLVR
jgi:serine/threonine-protein kinase RsbW